MIAIQKHLLLIVVIVSISTLPAQTLELIGQLYTDNPHTYYKGNRALLTLYEKQTIRLVKDKTGDWISKQIEIEKVKEYWNDSTLFFSKKNTTIPNKIKLADSQVKEIRNSIIEVPDTMKNGWVVHRSHYYPSFYIRFIDGPDTLCYHRGINAGSIFLWRKTTGKGAKFIVNPTIAKLILAVIPSKFLNRRLLEEECNE